MSTFADNLKFLLKYKGDTQSQLAKELDLTTASVSRYCSGEQIPRIDVLDKIADYFAVDVSDLFAEDTIDKLKSGEFQIIYGEPINIPLDQIPVKYKLFKEIENLSNAELQRVHQYIQFLKYMRHKSDTSKDNV